MIEKFVRQSNKIEGIHRDPTEEEIAALDNFLDLDGLDIDSLCSFVSVNQPEAKLRVNGECVRVGNYFPPRGGQRILYSLKALLKQINNRELSPYEAHVAYETLHPFTDCNGRSGRAIWAWQMTRDGGDIPDFLHIFYYQALSASGDR